MPDHLGWDHHRTKARVIVGIAGGSAAGKTTLGRALADPALRELLDICVYVDASKEVRLGRRLTRDVAERGRDVASCLDHLWSTVWPMHELYVGPSRCHAHVVVHGDAITSASVAALARKVQEYGRREKRTA